MLWSTLPARRALTGCDQPPLDSTRHGILARSYIPETKTGPESSGTSRRLRNELTSRATINLRKSRTSVIIVSHVASMSHLRILRSFRQPNYVSTNDNNYIFVMCLKQVVSCSLRVNF